GRVVVVEVAGADAELGRDQRGRDVRLAEAVEQLERRVEDALGRSARCLRAGGHARSIVPVLATDASTGTPPRPSVRLPTIAAFMPAISFANVAKTYVS